MVITIVNQSWNISWLDCNQSSATNSTGITIRNGI